MKSVLISIRPQWCEKIVSGEKTIEVRKTAPKEVPFKCYIYMTQGKFADFERERLENFLTAACLSEEEVVRYRENLPYCKPLYGWHISDLKIYDKPRELSEFWDRKKITRPPQSWQYVEELGNE